GSGEFWTYAAGLNGSLRRPLRKPRLSSPRCPATFHINCNVVLKPPIGTCCSSSGSLWKRTPLGSAAHPSTNVGKSCFITSTILSQRSSTIPWSHTARPDHAVNTDTHGWLFALLVETEWLFTTTSRRRSGNSRAIVTR